MNHDLDPTDCVIALISLQCVSIIQFAIDVDVVARLDQLRITTLRRLALTPHFLFV